MTIIFISAAVTLDWILCELFPVIDDTFWLDDLIEEQIPG